MAPVPPTESTDLEVAERVRAFVDVLRRFAAPATAPTELAQWAKDLWPESRGGGTPFPGHGPATVAFDSIGSGTAPELRTSDVLGYIHWLTVGRSVFPVRVCALRIRAADLAERLALPTMRYVVEGRGWTESIEFASPITGRCFLAESSMLESVPRGADVVASETAGRLPPLLDLFNTLGVDAADCVAQADEPERWQILRQDDNGNRARVASFSGLLKARRELARLEAKGHKQMYWIEPMD